MGTQFSGTVFRAALGRAVPVAGQGCGPPRPVCCWTVFVLAGMRWGVLREFHRAAPAAPVLAGAHRDRNHGRGVDGGAGAARSRHRSAARAARRGAGGGRSAGSDDRVRLRPHVQPGGRQGTAVGIVNVGGFSARCSGTGGRPGAWRGGRPGRYTPAAFRVAWCVQYLVWGSRWSACCGPASWRGGGGEEAVVVPPLRVALGGAAVRVSAR